MLAAIAVVSLTGAVVIPPNRPGLGWAITALVLLALMYKDFKQPRATDPSRLTRQ